MEVKENEKDNSRKGKKKIVVIILAILLIVAGLIYCYINYMSDKKIYNANIIGTSRGKIHAILGNNPEVTEAHDDFPDIESYTDNTSTKLFDFWKVDGIYVGYDNRDFVKYIGFARLEMTADDYDEDAYERYNGILKLIKYYDEMYANETEKEEHQYATNNFIKYKEYEYSEGGYIDFGSDELEEKKEEYSSIKGNRYFISFYWKIDNNYIKLRLDTEDVNLLIESEPDKEFFDE